MLECARWGAPHSDSTSLSLLGYAELVLSAPRIASTGVAADILDDTKIFVFFVFSVTAIAGGDGWV